MIDDDRKDSVSLDEVNRQGRELLGGERSHPSGCLPSACGRLSYAAHPAAAARPR